MKHKIIYYVAISLDGFIAGENGDISMFLTDGEGVRTYLSDLQRFSTTIMGKNTYEFGYRYGLMPGQPAYPHMEHFIFSKTLQLPPNASKVKVVPPNLESLDAIMAQTTSDVYLCGGGTFAAWLLQNEKIDELHLKINPILLGKGIPLFGDQASKAVHLKLLSAVSYEEGLQLNRYQMIYHFASDQ